MIKTRAFRKSTFREVKSSITRFISLALISFLGAGMFAGLASVSPNMQTIGDKYYDSQNVMDARLVSTYGFDDADVEALKNTAGITAVMPGYTLDITASVEDKDYTLRLNSLPTSTDTQNKNYLNQLKLLEGRLPTADNEAVILRPATGLKNIQLGSTLSLKADSNKAFKDTLDQKTFTVVGIAESPYYLSIMQGTTNIGNGSIEFVVYIPESTFTLDIYTDMYVSFENAKELNSFSQDYFDKTSTTLQNLKDLALQRQTLRHDQLWADLKEGEEEYNTQKLEAEQKLKDGENQLLENEAKLTQGRDDYNNGLTTFNQKKQDALQQLAEGRNQLDQAAAELKAGWDEVNKQKEQLNSGSIQLVAARQELDAGQQELATQKEAFNQGKADFEAGKAQLQAAQDLYDQQCILFEQSSGIPQTEIENTLANLRLTQETLTAQIASLSGLASLKADLDQLDPTDPLYAETENNYLSALTAAGLTPESAGEQIALLPTYEAQKLQLATTIGQLEELIEGGKQLNQSWQLLQEKEQLIISGEAQIAAAEVTLKQGEDIYATNLKKITQGQEQLAAAEVSLTTGQEQYNSARQEFNLSESAALIQLANGEQELQLAKDELDEGERKLQEGKDEFEKQKEDANTKLAEGEAELKDARSKLEDLGEAKWYVLDRNLNESFLTFYDDSKRMQDLSTVFPVIFFLVAALVSLTTMTRMVDEDRVLIGTFKALGYSNSRIAGRYLLYALSASLIGSILGVILGFRFLPLMIWQAYGMMFALPTFEPNFYLNLALISVFASVSVITVATGFAAKKALGETPADLMRPKAPKIGKRIFLEYITPVWKRLSFTRKVTVRNLGLNKKRLLMTLIGILGCTALVVTSFATRAAVQSLVSRQFVDIFHYDVVVGLSEDTASSDLQSRLDNKEYFENSSLVMRRSGEATLEATPEDSNSIFILAPEKSKDFQDFISLTDSHNQAINFDDNSVVITEKLASNLQVKVGDSLMLNYLDSSKRYPVTITATTQNYTFNYVYLGKTAYENAFAEKPVFNQYLGIKAANQSDDSIKSYVSAATDAGTVSFTADMIGDIQNSMKSINNIIWILIISAGLLAATVLYNLININISERQRELATLKVLGFYDKETYSYIFKETVILSILGCFAGLIGGFFLYRAVIKTIEPDSIMFTREISWQAFVMALILIMAFTWLVNQIMKPKIRRIHMLESLKSVD